MKIKFDVKGRILEGKYAPDGEILIQDGANGNIGGYYVYIWSKEIPNSTSSKEFYFAGLDADKEYWFENFDEIIEFIKTHNMLIDWNQNSPMSYDERQYCINKLLAVVPELNQLDEPLKSRLNDYLEDEFIYCIYESILCDYFLELIKNPSGNREIIKRIVNLIEDLATHENYNIQNVASVGFVENLLAYLSPCSDIEKYLLPKSLQFAKELGWDILLIDYRAGWKQMKYGETFSYERYFVLIENEPKVKDSRLRKLINELYKPSGLLSKGVQRLYQKSNKSSCLNEIQNTLKELKERMLDKKSMLAKDDYDIAKAIANTLLNAVDMAKSSN